MNKQELAKQTLDQILQAQANARRIIGLVKESGKITERPFRFGLACELNSAFFF